MFTVDSAAWAALAAAGYGRIWERASPGGICRSCRGGRASVRGSAEPCALRAEWMQEAAENHSGAMAAVLGKTANEAEQLAAQLRAGGVLLLPVNYNCPGQTVVRVIRAGSKR